MDQRTRKLMTMPKALDPRDDVDRLYVSRKGRRGLTTIEYTVDASIQRLEDYTKKHGGRRITATRNNTDNASINRTKITRTQKWEEKLPYGYFMRQTSKISHEKAFRRLRKGNLKRETESLRKAAQNNTIRTNYIKVRIDNSQQNSKCRLCSDCDETNNQIISKCCKLTLQEYKTRHDWVGKVIQLELRKKFKFDHTNKWYILNREYVLENGMLKILWDFEI